MKTVLTLILMIAVIFCLTTAPTKASAGGEESILIELGLKGLASLFSGIFSSSNPDSKNSEKKPISETEIQRTTWEVRENVIKRAKELLKIKLTFDTFHDGIKVSPQVTLLTFNGTSNSNQTLISIIFTADNEQSKKITYDGLFIIWDNVEEYEKETATKETLIKSLNDSFPSLGLVNPIPTQPQKTPSSATEYQPQPQPAPQPVTPATAAPETAPADTAPPAPSTALSNNP